jgi:hypothetical protein
MLALVANANRVQAGARGAGLPPSLLRSVPTPPLPTDARLKATSMSSDAHCAPIYTPGATDEVTDTPARRAMRAPASRGATLVLRTILDRAD